MHSHSSATDGNWKFNFSLFTLSNASMAITASHQTPKQEFSSLWERAETIQQRKHSTSG